MKKASSQTKNMPLMIAVIVAILFVIFYLMQKNSPTYAPTDTQLESQMMQEPIETNDDLNETSKDLEMTDINQVEIELDKLDAEEIPADL